VSFADLPRTAAWEHEGPRSGTEVSAFVRRHQQWILTGSTTAVEDDTPWWVAYEIEVDDSFATRRAYVTGRGADGAIVSVSIRAEGRGHWTVDGRPAPDLAGCVDVDLESSALTNALPLRRLGLAVGGAAAAPAVYVRAQGLMVERLEQRYHRRADGASGGPSVDYSAPAFEFSCRIDYDAAGLVVDYPGIARRVG
jgi:uncharacterized protein